MNAQSQTTHVKERRELKSKMGTQFLLAVETEPFARIAYNRYFCNNTILQSLRLGKRSQLLEAFQTEPVMWYRLLGQVGVKFVYEGGVGALPLSENGNKARRRKEAIAN